MNTHFEIYLARFIEWMKAKGWSERTVSTYTADVRFFIDYLTEEAALTTLPDIDAKTFSQYQTYLYHYKSKQGKKERLALISQHNRLVSLRSFFHFLYMTDVLTIDLSVYINLPKKRKGLPKGILSEKQVQKLLEVPNKNTLLGFRDRTVLEVLYATGIRNSELRNLMVYDIDLPQLQLTITKGKNAKDRIVPIGEIAAGYLMEYLQIIRPRLVNNNDNQLLFISKNGKQITQANLVWLLHKYVKKAKLNINVTPHSLRHSCATHMLKHGADLRYIQEMLGHASVATTQIYTRVEAGDLKRVYRRYHPRERFYDDES
jgi:integrase/recombinase XerD